MATLFFVAALLPILGVMLSVVLDLGVYYAESARLQRTLDDAALYANRYLPYREAALAAARTYLAQHGVPSAEVEVTADTLSLSVSRALPLKFANLAGLSIDLPLTAYTRARSVPRDALLVLDTSSYMAPDILNGPAWGDLAGWPAADYFVSEHPVRVNGLDLDPRLVTQQCFNPALSAVKQGVISVYEYLSAFSHNSVGVAAYPGTVGPVYTLREVTPAQIISPDSTQIPGSAYNNIYVGDALCLAAARASPGSSPYAVPVCSAQLNTACALGGPEGNSTLSNIWSLAARLGQVGDISALLQEVTARLAGAGVVAERGGLSALPEKVAFIFSGDLPRSGGERFPHPLVRAEIADEVRRIGTELRNANVRLVVYYVLFAHPGSGNLGLEAQAAELSDYLAQISEGREGGGGLILKALFVSTPDRLVSEVASLLVLAGRRALVAK